MFDPSPVSVREKDSVPANSGGGQRKAKLCEGEVDHSGVPRARHAFHEIFSLETWVHVSFIDSDVAMLHQHLKDWHASGIRSYFQGYVIVTVVLGSPSEVNLAGFE